MNARSSDELHRASSQLELLFDLTFVIAIASLTSRFAHAIGSGHAVEATVPFLQVFFAIWWAWVNFTWFASSFDTDDVPLGLLTLVQMAGVARGRRAGRARSRRLRAATLGYGIMRLGLLTQWLRAAIEDPSSRATALRYATGITLAEVAWVLRLRLDEAAR
jgi:low temperature requirement protein LtrA